MVTRAVVTHVAFGGKARPARVAKMGCFFQAAASGIFRSRQLRFSIAAT